MCKNDVFVSQHGPLQQNLHWSQWLEKTKLGQLGLLWCLAHDLTECFQMGNGPFINDLPVKDADFQEQTVTLAQGNS